MEGEFKGKTKNTNDTKKSGERMIDKLFIIRLVFNGPFFKFLITNSKDTTPKAGTADQMGRYTPTNTKIGKRSTRTNWITNNTFIFCNMDLCLYIATIILS